MTTSRPVDGRVAGVLLAAGASERLGVDKIWVELGGQPLIGWSLQAFAAADCLDEVVVVVRAGCEARMQDLLGALGLAATVVAGGRLRQDSVAAGLQAARGAAWVVVHDGARPLVTPDLIAGGLAAAAETGAAIAAVPVVDTVKRVQESTIVETLDRSRLWAAQTPQVFRRELLVAAHARAGATPATDDAMLVEALGVPVRVYMGAYGNIKVTNAVDLKLAALLLAARRDGNGPDDPSGTPTEAASQGKAP